MFSFFPEFCKPRCDMSNFACSFYNISFAPSIWRAEYPFADCRCKNLIIICCTKINDKRSEYIPFVILRYSRPANHHNWSCPIQYHWETNKLYNVRHVRGEMVWYSQALPFIDAMFHYYEYFNFHDTILWTTKSTELLSLRLWSVHIQLGFCKCFFIGSSEVGPW